ncbi:MAG TPA: TraR/DksA C4-type zinc finger protein [Armatimonadota bacterium]|nr:TraR/DksA C4-type zinc finger protein [Armatimonadota bacterium]
MAPRKHKLAAKRVKEFKKRLLAEKERLAATIEGMVAKGPGGEFDGGGDDSVDFDDAASDAALETLYRGTDMALEENLRVMLTETEAALEKIGKSSYGVCDNCDTDIKIARLERIPSATTCVDCQQRLERR